MKHFNAFILFLIFSNCFSQTIDFKEYDNFLKKHVSTKGVVDYDKVLKNIKDLENITKMFSKISPNDSWTESEYKAFWINLYNANIIKLLAENYPIKSINYITGAFKNKTIDFDGVKISLDFIEHDVIRSLGDPRVHFALYSTANSSPVLKKTAYNSDSVEKDLGIATSNFLHDTNKNKITITVSRLSPVFKWYAEDFGNKEKLRKFINTHMNRAVITDKTVISYLEYDWNLHRK